jgi:hypothetical protein
VASSVAQVFTLALLLAFTRLRTRIFYCIAYTVPSVFREGFWFGEVQA